MMATSPNQPDPAEVVLSAIVEAVAEVVPVHERNRHLQAFLDRYLELVPMLAGSLWDSDKRRALDGFSEVLRDFVHRYIKDHQE